MTQSKDLAGHQAYARHDPMSSHFLTFSWPSSTLPSPSHTPWPVLPSRTCSFLTYSPRLTPPRLCTWAPRRRLLAAGPTALTVAPPHPDSLLSLGGSNRAQSCRFSSTCAMPDTQRTLEMRRLPAAASLTQI